MFTRKDLKETEQQLDKLDNRLQSDLATAAIASTKANEAAGSRALAVGQSLLTQLKTTKPVGRLAIDLNRVIAESPGSASDVLLKDGDELIVPKQKQEVTVIGEVQNSISHFYRDNLSRDEYITLSGGLTRKADRKPIY